MALPIRRRAENGDSGRSAPPAGLERINPQLAGYLDAWPRLPDLFGAAAFTPVADVEETDDAYLVEIELAGVSKDDIDIDIAGPRLSVRGERKEKERVGILRRRERSLGSFVYEVTLPGDVDDADVTATFDQGVLTIRVPKPEHAKPRRIKVT